VRAPGWPAELADGPIRVRPLSRGDARDWCELRRRNHDWLQPWESTVPHAPRSWTGPVTRATYRRMLRSMRRQARAGVALPFAVDADRRLVGQVTVTAITRGSLQSGTVGYWVDQSVAGRGIIPTAVALVVDHCLTTVGLHRVEVNIRPENARSRRVADKLGFRNEGLRQGYLHIDGRWCDHVCYALTVEDAAGGVLKRYRRGLDGGVGGGPTSQ